MKTMEKTLEALATKRSKKLKYKERRQAMKKRKTCSANT